MTSSSSSGPVTERDHNVQTVDAPAGKIRGIITSSSISYKGIPYAEPPVGRLRFARPVKAASWTGTLNAFTFGPAPAQPDRQTSRPPHAKLIGENIASEDCLYLNVWRPLSRGPHPVLVWIYGGSNISGATSAPIIDGDSFARQGIVCVTIGYRVGMFGFLELGQALGREYAGSGNNAIRDQLLSLKWVQDNIASFDGDPRRITLAGESAGAKNVAALLGCVQSQGLYSAAIIESGSAQTVHTLESAEKVTALLLDQLKLPNPRALMSLPTSTLLAAQKILVASYPRNFAFRSIVDGDLLTDVPLTTIRNGSTRDIRLLAGSNHDESLIFLPHDLVRRGLIDTTTEVPIEGHLLSHLDQAQCKAITRRYDEQFAMVPAFQRGVMMLTAEEYGIPTLRIAEAHAENLSQTYMYRFDRKAIEGPFTGFAVHASEMPYTWSNCDPFYEDVFGRPEVALQCDIHKAWTSFVSGYPPRSAGLPEWKPFTNKTRYTMLLSEQSHLVADPAAAERQLWEGLL